MAGYIPTEEAALVVWFADHAASVSTHGATVGLSAADITQAAADAATVSHAVNGRSLYNSKAQEFTAYKDILLYAPLNAPLPATPAPPAVGSLAIGALASCVARARRERRGSEGFGAPAFGAPAFGAPAFGAPAFRPGTARRQAELKPSRDRKGAGFDHTTAIGEDCRIIAPVGPIAPAQPTLKAAEQTDFAIRLTFAMLGHDQLEIQSKRAAEAEFTLLAYDTNSPYLDARPPLVPGQPEVRQYRARWRDDDAPFGDWSDIVQVTARP